MQDVTPSSAAKQVVLRLYHKIGCLSISSVAKRSMDTTLGREPRLSGYLIPDHYRRETIIVGDDFCTGSAGAQTAGGPLTGKGTGSTLSKHFVRYR